MSKTPEEIKAKREQQRIDNMKKSSHKKSGNRSVVYFLVSIVVVIAFVVLSLTVFFKIKIIDVSGDSQYSKEQIVSTVSYVKGENLFLVDRDKIKYSLTHTLPYVKNVEISRSFPSKLSLKIIADTPVFAFEVDEGIILVDDEFKVLETVDKSDLGIGLFGVKVKKSTNGEILEFEDSEQKNAVSTIYKEILNQKITKIKQIDVSNTNDIKILYDGKHIWKIGNVDSISYKIRFGQSLSDKETETGVVDLSALSSENNNAFFHGEPVSSTFSSKPVSSVVSKVESNPQSSENSTVSSKEEEETVSQEEESEDYPEDEYEDDEEIDEEYDEDYYFDDEEDTEVE